MALSARCSRVAPTFPDGNAALVRHRRAPTGGASSSGRRHLDHTGPVRAQALGSRDGDDKQRGSPLRVFAPLREAMGQAMGQTTLGKLGQLAGQAKGLTLGAPEPSNALLEELMVPVVDDMEQCRKNLLNVVGERHPLLLAAADQIFQAGGKRLRPLIVFLVARATYQLSGLRCALARSQAAGRASGNWPHPPTAPPAC